MVDVGIQEYYEVFPCLHTPINNCIPETESQTPPGDVLRYNDISLRCRDSLTKILVTVSGVLLISQAYTPRTRIQSINAHKFLELIYLLKFDM